ncbi:MAG: pyridoxamine 5-phosphate oxidase-related FMN-binding protein [Actinomycetia bacterium]|nr:pyridoxamine 5-phosphate oxidase-related FMN-binding protein [Actinomycetes bacterium]
MTNWNDVLAAAPELGALVQARFEATGLAVLATLRADGAPRVSGIETSFFDGELCLGSMWEARKALDLRHDPRLALHAATVDKEVKDGDARVSGRAVEVDDEAWKRAFATRFQEETGYDPDANGPWHLFRVDVTELSTIRPGGDHLVIDVWHPGEAPRRIERR